MPINRVFDAIEKMLIKHGARQIAYTYEDGLKTGILFTIQGKNSLLPIKMPVRIKNIEQVFKKDGVKYKTEQPYKTGWKNVHDWIAAQLALLETEMVQMEEIFLPYILMNKDVTAFDYFSKNNYQLPGGVEEGTII